MLSQEQVQRALPMRRASWRVAIVVALMTIALSGLRDVARPVVAQAPAATTASSQNELAPLAYVPSTTVLVARLRPSVILGQATLAANAEPLRRLLDESFDFGFEPAEIRGLTVMMALGDDPKGPPVNLALIEAGGAVNVEKYRQAMRLSGVPRTIGGREIFVGEERARGRPVAAATLINESTILYADNLTMLRFALESGVNGWKSRSWADAWSRFQDQDLTVVVDTRLIRPVLSEAYRRADSALLLTLSPLWQNADFIVGGAAIREELIASFEAQCDSEDKALQLAETLSAARVLARNQLAAIGNRDESSPELPDLDLRKTVLDLAANVLNGVNVEEKESTVHVNVRAEGQATAVTIGLLLPAVQAARESARRSQAMNNMKQILLAFHNYHEVNKRFPGVINHKSPGDPGHSWRVAILPFVEQQALYEQYRFDERWDSDHNQQLLSRIPDVYRDPLASRSSTSPNYFVFDGGGAIFDGAAERQIRQITDGTSNTIAIVEAIREIPWTKPEDIRFDPDQLPPLGGLRSGGFNAAFADGSVRFISDEVDESVLKAMITASGGEVIPQ